MVYWYGSNNEFPPGQYTLGQSYFHSGGIAVILFCKFLCLSIYFDPQTPMKPNVIVVEQGSVPDLLLIELLPKYIKWLETHTNIVETSPVLSTGISVV